MNQVMLSIIVVNYKVKDELFSCIESIFKSRSKISFEIIVVDNDENKTIEGELKNKFKYVKYIKSKKNLGFGSGNNLGATYARGKYLFFLNPDTKILAGALDSLCRSFIKNKNTGIIAPVFVDSNLKPFRSQGSEELTPEKFLFSQSFLRKIFPSRNIYNKNSLLDWNLKFPKQVDAVPGAAMMISSNLFKKIGGFDEKFFLYFEENDISQRIRALGLKLYIEPSARIIHAIGKSTKHLTNAEGIYAKSRYLYIRKHYGFLIAAVTNMILSINKTSILILSILALGFFLRIVNLENIMPFIGDQGWFYLSARDMLLSGKIPLVGIASSHPWLHQGAYWTYVLSLGLWLFKFNPLAGAYVSISIDLLAILAIYKLGFLINSKRLGVIAAALYATSPLVIQNARMPYHTSPIPLFTILAIYFLYKWIGGNKYFFPLLILVLGILYNFELATASLGVLVITIFIYGLFKKQAWSLNILDKKIIFLSITAFVGSMFPMLIYDFIHGFPQTLGFIAWMGYRMLVFLGFPAINPTTPVSLTSLFYFFTEKYTYLVYPFSSTLALLLFVASSGYLLIRLRKKEKNIIVLSVINLFLIGGILVAKTPSDAYLPMLFPGLILITVLFFNWGFENKKIKDFIIPLFFLILLFNCFYMGYRIYVKDDGSFRKRLVVAREFVKASEGKEYNIIGTGEGSQFESFTMNYEYLGWWLGHGPSDNNEKLKFYVSEESGQIILRKQEL